MIKIVYQLKAIVNGDAESAKVAKIPFIYVRYGFGNVEEYDYVIDKFEEILTLEL